MEENFFNAVEELKRVDHLIYVSLKYTRTGDVIKNIISRLTDSYEFITLALLEKLKHEKKILDVPEYPAEQIKITLRYYGDDKKIIQGIEFYQLLRRINLADFQSTHEYRRNLTVKFLTDQPIVLDIDRVTEYYKRSMEFLDYIARFLGFKKDD